MVPISPLRKVLTSTIVSKLYDDESSILHIFHSYWMMNHHIAQIMFSLYDIEAF